MACCSLFLLTCCSSDDIIAFAGEGNNGYSLYNSVNYLTGLNCMREFARAKGDSTTVEQAENLIRVASASIQEHLWQPSRGFYICDTIDETPLLEPNGDAFHSSDDLHGQVLAYRLGFGDLLPREQMQSHQKYVSEDLMTPWGLAYDRYSHQSWLMSDHSNAALQLRWHQPEGWSTAQQQLEYFRLKKREATRHTAVINTKTGNYELLNYYGYALFFYHTLSAFSGQTINLPQRTLEFQPHPSAFTTTTAAGSGSGGDGGESNLSSHRGNGGLVAILPILLGGDLGHVTILPTSATLKMEFLEAEALSFVNITICQHSFAAGPYNLTRKAPLVLQLPTPCVSQPQ